MELLPRRSGAEALSDGVSVFQVANRAPLWRGRLNRWIVRRTLHGNPSDEVMLRGVSDALRFWFAREHLWGVGELVGNVRALARRRTLPIVGDVAARSGLLSPVPCMLDDSFASLAVDFVYFGRCIDMPWPVLDAAGRWEPVDCVWCVDIVGLPDGT